jgi:multidrug efflux pump
MLEGASPAQAYRDAAKRMAWPVITTTVTIVAAFSPLLFWPGIVGQFMKYLPITLIATLVSSILMALIFVPSLGAVFGRSAHHLSDQDRLNITAAETGDLSQIKGYGALYLGFLNRALDHPKTILSCAVALLVGIQIIFAHFGKGTQFFPSIEPESAYVQVRARGNLSVLEKSQLVSEVEQKLLLMKELKTVYSNTAIGSDPGARRGQELAPDTIGLILVEFIDWEHRRKAHVILKDIEDQTRDIPGLYIQIETNKPGPPTGKPIHIELSSPLYATLSPAMAKLRSYLETVKGLTAIEDSRPIPGLDRIIQVDRAKAAFFGADITAVGILIRFMTNGFKIDKFRPDDSLDEIDILVRYPEEYRSLSAMEMAFVQSKRGVVPLSSFTTQSFRQKVDTINRIDGHRVMTLKADTEKGVFGPEKVKEIQQWLAKNPLDPSITVEFKGEDEDKKETSNFLGRAFLLTLFLIAFILVIQFNSFFGMAMILTAILFSTIGVFVGLLIFGKPFNIVMGGIGVIALSGIIVSNNIILIDTYDKIKHHIADIREAVLRAAVQRLRPVILTKLTMVLGLLPLVFKLNIDFLNIQISYDAPSTQWWVDLSDAIVFGVIFATSITLFVTPCALYLKDRPKTGF